MNNVANAYEEEMKTINATAQEMPAGIDLERVKVGDVIALTARLAQILAEEADHLESMKISKVADLQHEKIMLTNALDVIKKQVAKHPQLLAEMDEQDREDLTQVITVFHQILEENYKRLNMARAVNQRIVEAITDVVRDQSLKDSYDHKGQSQKPVTQSLSVTLNEKI